MTGIAGGMDGQRARHRQNDGAGNPLAIRGKSGRILVHPMRRTPCHYAVVRFRPYAETGEFVNVGLAVVAPEAGEFAFKCDVRRRRRVSQFFPELESVIFQSAMQGMAAELNRMAQLLRADLLNPGNAAQATATFRELTRPREGLLSFGTPGTLLAVTAEAALEELHGRYIQRKFAQRPEYQEALMQRQLGQFLGRHHLRKLYRSGRMVGNEQFHVLMPFVHERNARVVKALKPLDLDRKEPTDVYQHGDQWLTALKRLREFGHAPDHMVFPVRLPQLNHLEMASCALPPRHTAARELVAEFRQAGAVVVDFEDQAELALAVKVEDGGQTELAAD
jgi:hypothetical protein